MTTANKFLLTAANFRMPFLLLAVQSTACVALLLAYRSIAPANELPAFSLYAAARWLHVTLLLIAMLYSGSKGLASMPVANFTMLKNLTIIAMAISDVKLFSASLNPPIVLGCLLVVSTAAAN